MNFLGVTIIRMIVAFVAGGPAQRLLPLSRRFVPEPVQVIHMVIDPRIYDIDPNWFGLRSHRMHWRSLSAEPALQNG